MSQPERLASTGQPDEGYVAIDVTIGRKLLQTDIVIGPYSMQVLLSYLLYTGAWMFLFLIFDLFIVYVL